MFFNHVYKFNFLFNNKTMRSQSIETERGKCAMVERLFASCVKQQKPFQKHTLFQPRWTKTCKHRDGYIFHPKVHAKYIKWRTVLGFMRAAVTRADAASGAAPAIPALITIETKLSVIKSDPLQITSTVNSSCAHTGVARPT